MINHALINYKQSVVGVVWTNERRAWPYFLNEKNYAAYTRQKEKKRKKKAALQLQQQPGSCFRECEVIFFAPTKKKASIAESNVNVLAVVL